MRIAHVGGKGLPSRGGTERVIEALATRQAAANDVTVYGSTRVCSSGVYNGVRVVAIPVPRGKYLGPVWLAIASALLVLFSRRYDIVHIHGAENTFTAPLIRLRSPVITTNHGPAYEREKWGVMARALMRMADPGSVKHADVATAVALSQAQALSRLYGASVRYIPNGVDRDIERDELDALRILDENHLVPGHYAMFAAARVDPTKGGLTLLRAWRELGDPMPLLFLGDLWHAPGHEDELRREADALSVVFLPRIEEKAIVAALVGMAQVFIFPSTVEAMSMMLLEVMTLGTPVIASDIVENTQVLPDDAWTFSAGDPSDLARAYREFAAESGAEVSQRSTARAASIRDEYSWDLVARGYDDVYRELVRSRRTAGAT